jgi:hypothetical protein
LSTAAGSLSLAPFAPPISLLGGMWSPITGPRYDPGRQAQGNSKQDIYQLKAVRIRIVPIINATKGHCSSELR